MHDDSTARKRALILVRESNEDLAKGWSPDEYVAGCRRKAAELGADVIEPPLIEVGKRNEWDSPKLAEALRLAGAGAFDYLISPDTARLAGDLGRLLWIKKELARSRVEIQYANITIAAGAEGDLHEIFLGGFDQYERMKIAMRFQNGIAGKLAQGLPIASGMQAYGAAKVYDERGRAVGYEPKDGEIQILRRIVRETQTRPLKAVAADLNAEGVPTPGGAMRWTESTVYKLITNRFYDGTYEYGRRKQEPKRRADGRRWWKTVKNDPSNVRTVRIAALVDPAELEAARAAMVSRRSRRRARCADDDDPFTLRGRLRCHYCDGVLSTKGAGRQRYYVCLRAFPRDTDVPRGERCRLPMVPAEPLERYAWDGLSGLLRDTVAFEAALARAADGGAALARHAEQVADLRQQIMRLRARIANGARQLRDFDPDGDTYHTLMAGQQADERAQKLLDASLATLERERPVVLQADGIRRAWELRDDLLAEIGETGEDGPAQRAIYGMLGTRGTVGLDAAGGVLLGRRHRWSVAWQEPDGLVGGLPYSQESGTLLILTPALIEVRCGS